MTLDMKNKPTREDGLTLFKKYNKSESLYKHALVSGGSDEIYGPQTR